MRILLLSRDQNALKEGSTTLERWRLLRDGGVDLRVITAARSSGSIEERGLSVQGNGGKNAMVRLWRLYRQASRELRTPGFDLVSAQDPFELGLIAWLVTRGKRVKLEIQDHGGFFDGEDAAEPAWFIRKHLAHWLVRRCDFVRTVSPKSAARLVAEGLGSKVLLLPIPAGRDFGDIVRQPEKGLIVSVGRLVKVKAMDLLLRGFAEHAKADPEAHLVILGDGPEKSALQALAKELGIDSKVRWVGEADPKPWLARAEVFILASRHEGWAIAAVEAAAAGVPVVMTPTGCADILASKGTAVVAERTPASIASAIQRAKSGLGRIVLDDELLRDAADWAGEYVAWWKKAVLPSILVCVQAVDSHDPFMGYFVSWLQRAAGDFSKINVLALRAADEALPKNVVVTALREPGDRSRTRAVSSFLGNAFRLRHEYSGVYVRGDVQYVLLAGWLWRLMNKKIVLWYAHFKPNRLLPWAARVANQVVTSVPEACAISSPKVMAIGQAIDESRFLPGERVPHHPLKVVALGRVSEAKRVLEMIETFRDPGLAGVELTIVGKPLDDGYAAKVRQAMKDADDIRWLAEDVAYGDVPALLQRYDAIINATAGSLDKVIIEASFCGLLPIAETAGLLSFVPADLRWLHAVDDASRIDALKRILAMTPDQFLDASKRIREAAIQKHSVSNQLRQLQTIFKL